MSMSSSETLPPPLSFVLYYYLPATLAGMFKDVYCNKNRIYYQAQVKQIKKPVKEGQKTKLLFHFIGWSAKYDEWYVVDQTSIFRRIMHALDG